MKSGFYTDLPVLQLHLSPTCSSCHWGGAVYYQLGNNPQVLIFKNFFRPGPYWWHWWFLFFLHNHTWGTDCTTVSTHQPVRFKTPLLITIVVKLMGRKDNPQCGLQGNLWDEKQYWIRRIKWASSCCRNHKCCVEFCPIPPFLPLSQSPRGNLFAFITAPGRSRLAPSFLFFWSSSFVKHQQITQITKEETGNWTRTN